jgi:hypothetical protein
MLAIRNKSGSGCSIASRAFWCRRRDGNLFWLSSMTFTWQMSHR